MKAWKVVNEAKYLGAVIGQTGKCTGEAENGVNAEKIITAARVKSFIYEEAKSGGGKKTPRTTATKPDIRMWESCVP